MEEKKKNIGENKDKTLRKYNARGKRLVVGKENGIVNLDRLEAEYNFKKLKLACIAKYAINDRLGYERDEDEDETNFIDFLFEILIDKLNELEAKKFNVERIYESLLKEIDAYFFENKILKWKNKVNNYLNLLYLYQFVIDYGIENTVFATYVKEKRRNLFISTIDEYFYYTFKKEEYGKKRF